jgi:choline dehydrogenase
MDSFDIVVIGGGSAGCALVSRLAARTDLRIALIEGGPDYGPRTSGLWPADLPDAHHTPDSHDWGLDQPRARVIGGCSVHNECALVRALPGDYERWAVPGWSDSDLTAVIENVARAVPSSTCSDDDLAAWQRAFLDSAVQAGFPRIAATDDPQVVSGVAPFPQNIVDGIRFHAAFAFSTAHVRGSRSSAML